MMGYTGHAFRFQVDPLQVKGASVTAYDWGAVLTQGLRNVGLLSRYKGGPGCVDPSPELVVDAVDLAQQSIDRGVPAIVWGLFLPDFGVLYGCDNDRSSLYGKDLYQNGTINTNARRRAKKFVLVLAGLTPVHPADALRDMLKITLDHLKERGNSKPPAPFRAGPAGYAAWIEAFRLGNVDPNGNAYHTHQLYVAREFAVAFFLCRLHVSWGNLSSVRDREIRVLGEAAGYYAEAVKALRKLRVLFPTK